MYIFSNKKTNIYQRRHTKKEKQFSLLKQDFCMDMFMYMLYIQISSDPFIY